MTGLKVQLYMITIIISGISCNTANLEEIYNGAENTRQSRDTGFDVGFSGLDFGTDSSRPQTSSAGFDSNSHPTFAQGGFQSNAAQPGVSQGSWEDHNAQRPLYSGSDGSRPSFSLGEYQGHGPQKQVDSGFHGTYPNYGYDEPRPGYSEAGYPGAYNPGYDANVPGYARGSDGVRPWFLRRYLRQANYLSGNRNDQIDFDSGFDGTRPDFINFQPSLDFDSTQHFPAGSEQTENSPRQRRGIDSALLDSEVMNQDVSARLDQPNKSEKFFFLQPHGNKNNLPFFPNWNSQQPGGYYPPYGHNNIGPYGPQGTPPNGYGGNYWR